MSADLSQLSAGIGFKKLFSCFWRLKPRVYSPLTPYQYPNKITCAEHIKNLETYRRNVKVRGLIAKEFYWEYRFKHRPREMSFFEWLKFWLRKRVHI